MNDFNRKMFQKIYGITTARQDAKRARHLPYSIAWPALVAVALLYMVTPMIERGPPSYNQGCKRSLFPQTADGLCSFDSKNAILWDMEHNFIQTT